MSSLSLSPCFTNVGWWKGIRGCDWLSCPRGARVLWGWGMTCAKTFGILEGFDGFSRLLLAICFDFQG